MMLELPYGHSPLCLDLDGRDVSIVRPTPQPAPQPLRQLLDDALDAPIGRPSLGTLLPAAGAGSRITLIVSDPSRAEPRAAFIHAIQRRLPRADYTIAVATGTHGRCNLNELGISREVLAAATVINHDGHAAMDLVELGTTSRGTPIHVHRCVVETDLVIATGCIRPHYFAGFGAGVKAIFPGLGGAKAIRINHAMKTEPGARAGITVGNPCREDLEEAVSWIRTPTFLLDGVCAPDTAIHLAVAGDPVAAFRTGAALARAWFSVRSPRAPLVIASDALPVTATLYQAAKIAAAVAPLVEDNGTLVIVAECPDGIGGLETVNEAILRIGVLPRLPPGAKLLLVSSMSAETVATTLVSHCESLAEVVRSTEGHIVVVPHASQLLFEIAPR